MKKRVIGGQVTPAEYELIKRSISDAGFSTTSAGVRAVLLAFAATRDLTPPQEVPSGV